MKLEDIFELEILGRVENVTDNRSGYILTIHLNDDKKGIAPVVVDDYFGARGIRLDEFSYSEKTGKLVVRYHLSSLE